MTTAIIYYSKHHGNTKRLLDAITASDDSVTLIDTTEQKGASDREGNCRSGQVLSGIVKAIRDSRRP